MSMERTYKSFDEIVFEHRNKAYGAYFLRKKYPQYIQISIFIVIGLMILLLGGPFVYNKYIKKPEPKKVEKVVEIDLTTIDIPPLMPDAPAPPPPPPPVEQPKIKTVRNVPPKVVPDKEVVIEELPPTVDEMKDAVISSVTQEGESDSLGLNDLVDSNNHSGIFGTGEAEDNTIYMPGAGIVAGFPGGSKAMYDYITKRLKPSVDKAAKLGDKGTVFLLFVVEKDGSITDVKVMKGLHICSSCNDAAKEVIENMPKWEPAKNNGKPVRVRMQLPIKFDFED